MASEHELISYDANKKSGTLITTATGLARLWSAITLIRDISCVKCSFTINNISEVVEDVNISSVLTLT